jgi:diguanylate cyclase
VIGALIRRLRRTLAESASLARERAGMMARFEEAAFTDELTGLPNRRAWEQALPRELERARLDGSRLSIGLIDLDHFKAYNDEHGHQAGDRLLRETAQLWRRRLRGTDILARYGGEEFAVALPDCTLDDAHDLVDRLRKASDEEQTCSAGIAQWDGLEEPDQLLRRADRALYAAKAAGRDRVVAEQAESSHADLTTQEGP